MAEETKPAEKPEAAEKPKKKNPIMMIGILGGVVLVLLGASYFAITRLTAPADATAQAGMAGGEEKDEGKIFKFEIKDLILNSADTGNTRFVKVGLVFEARDPKVVAELEEREYRVRDLLISLIGRRNASELSNAETREQLRTQILDELNSSLSAGAVSDVYFMDFIIQ